MKKRLLSLLLVFVLLQSSVPSFVLTAGAANNIVEGSVIERISAAELKWRNGERYIDSLDDGCSTCFGFMRELFQYVFNSSLPVLWSVSTARFVNNTQNIDEIGHLQIGYSLNNLQQLLAQAKPGDVLVASNGRWNHCVMIRSVGDNGIGIYVFDANWLKDKYGNPLIRTNSYWSAEGIRRNRPVAVTLYRYKNYITGVTIPDVSSLVINVSSYPTGSIKQGSSYPLYGTITSNYNITSITGAIINAGGTAVQSYTQSVNTKSYSIRGSAVDMNLKFGSLSPGTYTLKFTAKNSAGMTESWSSKSFTIAGEHEVAKHTTRTTQLNLRGLESTSNPNEGWFWDKETKTLTLDNVNFEVADEPSALITESATIVLKGENIIKSTYNSNDTYITCGIYAVNGELKFKGEGSVTAIGGKSSGSSYGIAAGLGNRGSLTVDGALITAVGGISNSFDSAGIRSPKISVNSGSLTTIGGTGNSSSKGLYVYGGTLNITGGQLLASGGAVDHPTLPGANAGIYLGEGATMSLGAGMNLSNPINGYIAVIDNRNRASTILDSSGAPAQKVTIQEN